MTHILVTNDFPPKVGGIQAYLWELWRRLEPSSFAVLTASSHPDADAFDRAALQEGIRIDRAPGRVLLPTAATAARIRRLVHDTGASFVLLDPALPLGLVGSFIGCPYGVVLHGAEVAVPGRLPGSRHALAAVLERSKLMVCAGSYPAAEARRVVEKGRTGGRAPSKRTSPSVIVEVPPGVDTDRFRPLRQPQRAKVRAAHGLPVTGPLVLSVSRLVPRKGMDVLVEAAAALVPSFPDLTVVIAGDGRDRPRIEALTRARGAPVHVIGKVPDESLPALYGAADIFVMACRDRWLGLEQEGFGIVFLEAAACAVPQIAGRSGGSAEAVVDGKTGLVVDDPRDPGALAVALRSLLVDEAARRRMGKAARARAVASFGYDHLARRLAAALQDVEG
jgi:phosphatidyl-myo-inositol dimannoside synthase